jgi:hypothetical protein
MRTVLVLAALLGAAGVGLAGDKEIIKRLRVEGVFVDPLHSEGEFAVLLRANHLDAALAELCELRGLRQVTMHHPGLTDAQLQQVCALPGLRTLVFIDCPITDARLKIVARVRELRTLSLYEVDITNEGLAELTVLRNLRSLHINGAAISDVGLRHIEWMQGLRCVDLTGCRKVTEEGVAHLQQALPKCEIRR